MEPLLQAISCKKIRYQGGICVTFVTCSVRGVVTVPDKDLYSCRHSHILSSCTFRNEYLGDVKKEVLATDPAISGDLIL